VCCHKRTAFLSGHFDRQVLKGCLNRGRRRIWAQGRERSSVTMMACNQMKHERHHSLIGW
jgi:hypothetical protein